jgi:hypothetical protein
MTENFDYTPLHADFQILGRPARRALITAALLTPEAIANVSEQDLLRLHGMGPKSIPVIRAILARHGLVLKTT